MGVYSMIQIILPHQSGVSFCFKISHNDFIYYPQSFIFNMRTKPDSPVVIVNGFALFTKSTSKMKFELWSRLGNFKDYKGSLDGWEQIGKGSFKGEGPGIITTLPLDKITPVDIPGGGGAAGTRAFYLTLLSKDLAYNFGQGTESDAAIQIETPEIELWEGEVRCYYCSMLLLLSDLIVITLLF